MAAEVEVIDLCGSSSEDGGGSDSDVVFLREYKSKVNYVDLTLDSSSDDEDAELLAEAQRQSAKRQRLDGAASAAAPARRFRPSTARRGRAVYRASERPSDSRGVPGVPGPAAPPQPQPQPAHKQHKRSEKAAACFETSVLDHALLFSGARSQPAALPRTYPSVAALCDAFAPLLLEETREGLRSEWAAACSRAPGPRRVLLELSPACRAQARGWFTAELSPEGGGRLGWQDGEVAFLSSAPPGRAPLANLGAAAGGAMHFAALVAVRLERERGEGGGGGGRAEPRVSLRAFLAAEEGEGEGEGEGGAAGPPACGYTVGRLRAALGEPRRVWHAVPVGRTGAALAEFRAVVEARGGGLAQHYHRLLCAQPPPPPPPPPPQPLSAAFQAHLRRTLNERQREAVLAAAGCGASAPPLLLIQGPPGTGKTTTLVSMINALHVAALAAETEAIERIMAERCAAAASDSEDGFGGGGGDDSAAAALLSRLTAAKPHILVCAPSNAAVDVLLRRALSAPFAAADGARYAPRLLRLGSDGSVPADGCAQADARTRLLALERTAAADVEARLAAIAAELAALRDRLLAGAAAPAEAVRYRLACSEAARLRLARLLSGHRSDTHRAREAAELSMLDEADVVFATLGTAGRTLLARCSRGFDVALVDEAAQATEPATLIALLRGSRAVLVGDPAQLPATVLSPELRRARYGVSLFERLTAGGALGSLLLTDQFRMHPAIVAFPNAHFYGGRLRTAACVGTRPPPTWAGEPRLPPFAFFDVAAGREARGGEEGGVSFRNAAEAEAAAHLYCQLAARLSADERRGLARRVCFLTPYRGQVSELQRALEARLGRVEAGALRAAGSVATVDAFQGSERDVVIFCAVRTSGLGFVEDAQRCNVALTRARCSLWVLGCARALSASAMWSALLSHARATGSLLAAS